MKSRTKRRSGFVRSFQYEEKMCSANALRTRRYTFNSYFIRRSARYPRAPAELGGIISRHMIRHAAYILTG